MTYRHYLFSFLVLTALISFAPKNSLADNYKSIVIQQGNLVFSDTTYRIIPSINNTFGYEILIKQKVFIRQQNIPGLPGLNGFKRKADAEKTARLVINKLSHGIMPPSIEKRELDSLKIKL